MEKNIANVMLREDNTQSPVKIAGPGKPEIQDAILNKWQDMIDICAGIMKVPSSLIMRLHQEYLEVFLKSNSVGNPYRVGKTEQLGIGLYSETVVAKNEFLLVPDARKDRVWVENPDIKMNMVSYLGMPLMWPNDEVFGAICVLDNKENHYNHEFIKLLLAFRCTIETDLSLIVAQSEIYEMAHTDKLTRLSNRRKIDDKLLDEFKRATRYDSAYSLILFDIDNFKNMNDTFGHDTADEVLIAIAKLIKERVRSSDIAGRWGGEEMIVICPETELDGAKILAENLRELIENYKFPIVGKTTCSFGVSSYRKNDKEAEASLKRAEDFLNESKSKGKNIVISG